MEQNFQREALKKCVGLICQTIGFQGICAMPLEVLTDLLHRYLRETAVLTHRYAEHDNRTMPTLSDLSYAFLEMKVSLPELEEFTSTVDSVPFPDPIPKFPIPRSSELNFLKPGSREILSRPLHIHEHLPPMLPDLNEDGKLGGSPHPDQNGLGGAPGDGPGGHMTPNGASSPSRLSAFLSSAQRQTRDDQPDKNGLDGVGEPVREIDSVMMTTSGFISSAREGKLPEARMPHIPLPVIPHQTPTSRSSGGANSRNPSSTSAQSLAQTIAAKKKMSLERLMRHKHNMALKRAAQNTLNGLNNVNTSTPKTKSSKKSLSHSAVLSLAGAAVDSSLCFTTKHGKPKEKLKPKIPATPPGTSRFLTPSTPHLLAKKPGSAAGTPLGPPPKLKIPTPRQKQPEFSTDVLPLPKEDPKELEERELQLQRKKEKQKELARAARSGLLGAIVGSGGGHLMDASDEGGQTFNGVVAPETKTSKMPTSSSLLSNALKTKKEKKDREEKKDLKKISKEGRKDKDKKDKSDSKKDKLIKKKEEKERRDKKDLKKKEKDGSKKLKDSSKKDTKKDKEKKSKEGKIKLKEKKDKKLKKVSDASTIKSPRSTIASLDTSEISRPHSPSLTDASTIASLDVSSGFSPDASKSKLCVFKKSNKTHTKADSLSDDPFTSKPNVCIEDSYNTADASADMSGVLSSPSISASPLDVPGKIVKQKKRKRLLDDDSESPGDALSPKMKKSKSSPRAKSTKMSIDINAISGALDDNALPFTSSSCPMSSWDGRPSTPSGVHDFSTVKYPPTPSLYPQAPGLYPPAPGLYPPAPSLYPPAPSLYPPTPGLYPPTPGLYPHSFSSNTNAFSPLSCGTPDGFLEQTERPLTPGKARTPERSSRGVTPSGSFMPSGALCSDTPHSATSSSGPSPSPPEGEHSAGPHSPLDVASSNAFNFAGDSERKKKDKEHRKEKKEKDKIKKKKDKKLKEKLEKKQKEKLEKKEKKKKKSLEGGELGDVLLLQQTHLETPTPVAPKLDAHESGRRVSSRVRTISHRYR